MKPLLMNWRRARPLGLAGVLVLVLASLPCRARQGSAYAILNTRVVVGDGEVLENVHVVVRDGLIEAVGTDVTIPADAERMEGEKLAVQAGFLDGFGALGVVIPEPAEDAPPGNAGPEPDFSEQSHPETRDANRRGLHPERRARDFLSLKDDQLKGWRLAGFTNALTAPPEGFLRGQSCLIDLSGQQPRTAIVTELPFLHASLRGSRGRSGGYPGTLMAVLAHVRQAFHDARRLKSWEELYRRKPRGTQRPPNDTSLQALYAPLNGEHLVVFEADSENDIHRALDLAEEFELRPLLVGGREAFKLLDRLVEQDVAVIARLQFGEEPEREGVKKKSKEEKKAGEDPEERDPREADRAPPDPDSGPEGTGDTGSPQQAEAGSDAGEDAGETEEDEYEIEDPVLAEPEKVFAERQALWLEQVRNVQALLDAGVTVALTGDGHTQGKEFLNDLRVAVEHGLPAESVRAALTTTPARLFGVEEQLGTVEAGKLANLILTDGELGTKDWKVRWVLVGGQRFEGEPEKDADSSAGEEPGEEEGSPEGAESLDLSGTWKLQGSGGPAGELQATLTLEQAEDGTLSGTLKTERGDREWPVQSGSLKQRTFRLTVAVEFEGQPFEFKLEGTAEEDKLGGSLETPFGEPIEFTATRVEDPEETSS